METEKSYGTGDSPFLPDLDISGVAFLVLRGLLNSLVELLVDCSTTSHQILLDATQASEDVIDAIETSLLELLVLVGEHTP